MRVVTLTILTLAVIMKIGRKLKAFLYYLILIGYFVGLFYLWRDFKRKAEKKEQGGSEMIIEKIE